MLHDQENRQGLLLQSSSLTATLTLLQQGLGILLPPPLLESPLLTALRRQPGCGPDVRKSGPYSWSASNRQPTGCGSRNGYRSWRWRPS